MSLKKSKLSKKYVLKSIQMTQNFTLDNYILFRYEKVSLTFNLKRLVNMYDFTRCPVPSFPTYLSTIFEHKFLRKLTWAPFWSILGVRSFFSCESVLKTASRWAQESSWWEVLFDLVSCLTSINFAANDEALILDVVDVVEVVMLS